MKRAIITVIALGLSAPVLAQVYKCNEGGKVVYSQMPCEEKGERIKLHVHQPTEAERLRAEAQSLREQAFNARVDGEKRAAERRSRGAAEQIQANKDAKAEKCAGYEAEIRQRESTQDKWISPGLRQQDHDRVRELKNRHFSECFAR